jgi:DNA-binding transcriptional regulator YhcF (GntR family)
MHALNEQSPTVYKRDPLYRQIARQLRRQILSGEFEAGDALPPVRHLAAEHGVHFNTIARSYRLLEQEGLVTMRPGRGTRVEPNRPERDATPDPIFKAMISDCLDLGLRLG